MSDFLSNLVTRSVEAAPAIQPRLPSLFEPARPYMSSFAQASQGREEAPQETPMKSDFEDAGKPPSAPQERRAPAINARAERMVNHESPRLTAQPMHADEPTRGQAVRMPDNVSPPRMGGTQRESSPAVQPAVAQSPPGQKPTRLSMPSSESSRGNSRPAQAPSVSAHERNAVIGDFVAPAILPRSSPAVPDQPTPQHSATRSEVPARVTQNSSSPKIETPREFHAKVESHAQSPLVESPRLRNEDMASRAQAAIAPASAPRFEFARHVPPAPHVSPPEPTIQVTIGRIEVRAVSQQSATPKERTASPVMSLKDYLRSRRGGA
jgi:hypothetical protein